MTTLAEFRTGYMDGALTPDGLAEILKEAQRRLRDVDFDTMVGTGFSGGVVIPALALAMGKHFALIRKESDDSHHGPGRILGHIGARWIFVDDFVSTGGTRRRVIEKVEKACRENVGQPRPWNPATMTYAPAVPHITTYVGDYTYTASYNSEPGFRPAEETS
jgi:hypothetical protein